MKIPNKVIIIGSNHHNTLGLVRSFGINGIKPYGILLKTQKSFVLHSKYWEKVFEVKSLDEVVDVLNLYFGNEENKPVLIPVFDENAELIDRNFDVLRNKFIIPSITQSSGEIVRLMDKYCQACLAEENNIPVLPSAIISSDIIDFSSSLFEIPCILKPVASVEGEKTDIKVCMNQSDVDEALKKFAANDYSRILVQKYLVDRREFCCSGAISKTGSYVYSLVENIRRWPEQFGVGSFAKFSTEREPNIFAERLLKLAANIGYSGPIDIEFFMGSDGVFYLNEYNWRSSGRNFISLYTGIHPAVEYVLDSVGITEMQQKANNKSGTVIDEKSDIWHVIRSRKITLIRWMHDFLNAKSYSLWYIKDLKPAIYEYWRLLSLLFHR